MDAVAVVGNSCCCSCSATAGAATAATVVMGASHTANRIDMHGRDSQKIAFK